MYKLGFLGTGVMAGAILGAVLNNSKEIGILPGEIVICDKDANKMQVFAGKGVKTISDAATLFGDCECVLLGIKPQQYAEILGGIKVFNCGTVISIMAGVKTQSIAALTKTSVVRAMPNIAATIGKGATAVYVPESAEKHKEFILKIFTACGIVVETDEKDFDAVTSISGSGPAYVYLFAEYLAKAGVAGGLSYENSKKLAIATIEGAAGYAKIAVDGLETLVDKVCSPGGTTIEAITKFKENGLEEIVNAAVTACREKSALLSQVIAVKK